MRRSLFVILLSLLLGAFVTPPQAKAGYAFVDCSGNTEGAFTSINDALAFLNSTSPDDPYWNWIEVTGTCTENVWVNDQRKLAIAASWEQTATINSANPNAAPLSIGSSRSVYLYGLILTGGSSGLEAFRGSEIYMERCIAESNSWMGVNISGTTLVTARNLELRNNGWAGLFVAENSQFITTDWDPDSGLRISNNGGPGVSVDYSLFLSRGGVTVENNLLGLEAKTGKLVLGGGSLGGNIIRGNRLAGVSVVENSEVAIWGQNLIQNNGPVGVRAASGSNADIFGYEGGSTTIEGHTDAGIEVKERGQLMVWGLNFVRNNGSGHPSAGIRVDQTSQFVTMMNGLQVTNNMGSGIFADVNSSIDLSNITVSGNTGPGVLLLHQSVGELGSGILGGGNGGGALACDQRSLVITNFFSPGQNCQSIEPAAGRPKPRYSPKLQLPKNSSAEVFKGMYQRLRKQAMHVR